MKPCPQTSDCALYARFSTQGFLRIWQITYCEADYTRCARYQRSSQGQTVAPDLLPNGTVLGEKSRRRS
jgi:hypothetical protein